ncbi:ATPase, T2SS/T4P/T4SS family [Moraxella oculi]|uniref:ATPase, T2SS/T4P/T4SS family n=1 Tax=Moraxella oculi TaxID=2940516 RepID=A0ABW8UAA2_9GAMM
MSLSASIHGSTAKPVLSNDTALRGFLSQTGIQSFLDDKRNTEIAINRPYEIWTESSQGWQRHELPQLDYTTLKQLANSFGVFNKFKLDEHNPICNGILPDGQRGQFVIPTACELGTVSITIRQPSQERFAISDYGRTGRLDRWVDKSNFQTSNTKVPTHLQEQYQAEQAEIEFLNKYLGIPDDVHLQLFELQMLKAKAERDTETFIELGIKNYVNFCLVGATGSGKTTFTKALCDLVPSNTRIITIEDTHELDLPNHPNRVHLFYKDVTPKQLLASTLRMKPDRIFLTELRGDEAYDYLNALNTGHGGSITTVHANDCQSAYYRVGTLVKQSEIGSKMDFEQIMRDVYITIDVMMFLNKTYVSEISYDPVRKYRLQLGKVA